MHTYEFTCFQRTRLPDALDQLLRKPRLLSAEHSQQLPYDTAASAAP